MADNEHDLDLNDKCCRLEEKLVEEAHTIAILIQALKCIVDRRDSVDPVRVAQETLEAYKYYTCRQE